MPVPVDLRAHRMLIDHGNRAELALPTDLVVMAKPTLRKSLGTIDVFRPQNLVMICAALGDVRLSINADPHYAVLVRHDGGNNVIGVLKPRRVRPDCDQSATGILQSLAQLCMGFARYPTRP
jgi:hypothetical protein